VRLADLLATMGPYLLGQASNPQVLQSLLGEQASAQDGKRLQIYGDFCRQHRLDAVDHVFSYCRSTVVANAGLAAWEELVERYFHAHPMHHFELNRNGRHFPEFLTQYSLGSLGDALPFLPELADLEWWEWQTYSVFDDPRDEAADTGELRVASTVELRPYAYDLLAWIDERAAHGFASPPVPVSCLVLFWRDRDLDLRRTTPSSLELMLLKAVIERIPLDDAFMHRVGISAEAIQACMSDLHSLGIIHGAVPTLPNPARS